VVLCCSHTHSGPAVGHNLRTLHYDLVDAEQQKLIDQLQKSEGVEPLDLPPVQTLPPEPNQG